MKTYIVHYDKLTERKKFMDYQLQLNNLNYEYVSNYGRDKLTMLDKNKFRNISDSIGSFSDKLEGRSEFKIQQNTSRLKIGTDTELFNKEALSF